MRNKNKKNNYFKVVVLTLLISISIWFNIFQSKKNSQLNWINNNLLTDLTSSKINLIEKEQENIDLRKKKQIEEKKKKDLEKKNTYLKIKAKIYKKSLEKEKTIKKEQEKFIAEQLVFAWFSWKKENINYFKDNLIEFNIQNKFPLYKQKYLENTCVIDNIWQIIKYQYWKEINKELIYNFLWKKKWEFWNDWIYLIWKEWEWYLTSYEKWEYIKNKNTWKITKIWNIKANELDLNKYEVVKWANDIQKLFKYWIETKNNNTFWGLKLVLDNKLPVLMEVPMNILWYKQTNIWHAITIISYNEKEKNFNFLNTLTWRIEKIKLSKLISSKNPEYLKYSYTQIVLNKNNIKKYKLIK